MSYLLMSRSLTYAQRSAAVLERAGITGTVARLPRQAGVRGCTYGVSVPARHVRRAYETLTGAGLSPRRIYIRDGEAVREVGADDLP